MALLTGYFIQDIRRLRAGLLLKFQPIQLLNNRFLLENYFAPNHVRIFSFLHPGVGADNGDNTL